MSKVLVASSEGVPPFLERRHVSQPAAEVIESRAAITRRRCPHCQSHDVRRTHRRRLLEHLLSGFGYYSYFLD